MSKVYQPQDKFFKKAKEQGYRARSAFKLQAIQDRFHLISPGDHVLDLGAAPGSFLQLVEKLVGSKGLAVGIDLKPIEDLKKPNIKTIVGDILDDAIYQQLGIDQFDVITSDLAPSTSGVKSVDAGRSFQLNEQVLNVAEKYLKLGGHVVMKAFPGAEHQQLLKKAKGMFKNIKTFKPEAVRKSSREEYVIGIERIA
ncbi:RlmE family RNA methyltransferase [Patescibacteria group bacterium]|nr:RlmE family RNA methyltransferase [Patescibacteria group bacterium]